MGNFVEEQKAVNVQLNQRVDTVESTMNKRIYGFHKEITQNLTTYSIPSLG